MLRARVRDHLARTRQRLREIAVKFASPMIPTNPDFAMASFGCSCTPARISVVPSRRPFFTSSLISAIPVASSNPTFRIRRISTAGARWIEPIVSLNLSAAPKKNGPSIS